MQTSKTAMQTLWTQPLEPCLFPRLRHNFADFPYLRSSIYQRLQTLETCCGYENDLTWKSIFPLDFHGMTIAHQTSRRVRCSADFSALSPHDAIPGLSTTSNKNVTNSDWNEPSKRKENSSQGNGHCLQVQLRYRKLSKSRFRNINPDSLSA